MSESHSVARRARWRVLFVAAAALAIAALLWRFTPLAAYASTDRLMEWIGHFRQSPWLGVALIGAYVFGGLLAFPLLLLITVTALIYEPLIAFPLALTGSVVNAVVLYGIGSKFIRGTVREAFGPTLKKVDAALEGRSVIAIAVIRMTPVAPFTFVNLALGSIGVPLKDYVLGTILGLVPGLFVLTVFGDRLRTVWQHPTVTNISLIVGVVIAWIALSLLLQRVVSRWQKRKQV